MNTEEIIGKYYPADNELRRILLTHSRAVADKCLRVAARHPELRLDEAFLREAAMLHDIGIVECHAPGICCFGKEPYICHGRIGAEMLRREGLPRHARVCERHTGAGLTRAEIVSQQLPLPLPPEQEEAEPYMPQTREEQVVCYADKFFSKTHPDREKTFEQACHSLAKFGQEGTDRFRRWHEMYG